MGRSLIQMQLDEATGSGVAAIKAAQQGPLIQKLMIMGLTRQQAIKAIAEEGAAVKDHGRAPAKRPADGRDVFGNVAVKADDQGVHRDAFGARRPRD